ncbi:hypothetical protein TURU_133462 [Turdus rufiventris]|nr:hypothetical protein TURU_133462 [Turdus rufiventris]
METPADCQGRARHDDITLGATGGDPGSGSIEVPNSSPASKISSDTAVTTAQNNTKVIQKKDISYHPAITSIAAAPTPSMFNSEITASFDPTVFWMKLARDYASEECRKIINTLPKENPSLEEMINACAKVGTASHNMEVLANSFAAAVIPRVQCFNCGQQGHVKANYPYKSTLQKKVQGQGNVNSPCDRCGKYEHETKVCRSKYHINGQLLKYQGNWKPRAMKEYTNAEVFLPPLAQDFVTNSP